MVRSREHTPPLSITPSPRKIREGPGQGVGGGARNRPAGCLPLHDDEQALPPRVQVLIDVHDAHDVWALGGPPVQLHLAPGLGAVLQHLQGKQPLESLRCLQRGQPAAAPTWAYSKALPHAGWHPTNAP